MAKKIIWTLGAQYERKDIFDYWTYHNKSSTFSIKLNERIERATDFISKHPKTGRTTDIESIRSIRIHHYLIIYEEMELAVYILSIWDARQDPAKLKKRLE